MAWVVLDQLLCASHRLDKLFSNSSICFDSPGHQTLCILQCPGDLLGSFARCPVVMVWPVGCYKVSPWWSVSSWLTARYFLNWLFFEYHNFMIASLPSGDLGYSVLHNSFAALISSSWFWSLFISSNLFLDAGRNCINALTKMWRFSSVLISSAFAFLTGTLDNASVAWRFLPVVWKIVNENPTNLMRYL